MSRALVIAAALAIAIAGGACRDERLEELRSIRDEVCACKTSACGEEAKKRVPQDQTHWDHRAQKIAKSMVECLAKLYLSERPPTDPDAEAPAPEETAPEETAPGGAEPAAAAGPGSP